MEREIVRRGYKYLEIVLLCEIFLNEFRFGSIALEHAAEVLVAVVVLGIAALGLLKRLFHLLKPVPSACAHTHGDGAGCTFYYCSHNRRCFVRYGCKDSANRAKYQRKTVFLCVFPLKKYPLWCVSKSKNDMVPFGCNPKSALSA